MNNTNVLPDRWTVEDIQHLLEQVETKQVLVADSALGLPTIHDFPGARHLGMGVFTHKTPDYTILYDAGASMGRTPSGQGWTGVRVEEGEFPYDFDGVRATLQGYLDNGHADDVEDEADPTGFIAGEGDAYDYIPSWMTVPKLYACENKDDPLAVIKLFTPDSNWTWYMLEYDGEDTCFGLVDGLETELGYFSLSEMREITGPMGLKIERDLWFKPTPVTLLPEYERQWGRCGGPYKGTPASVEAEPEPKPVAEPEAAPPVKRQLEPSEAALEIEQLDREIKELGWQLGNAEDDDDSATVLDLEVRRDALIELRSEVGKTLQQIEQIDREIEGLWLQIEDNDDPDAISALEDEQDALFERRRELNEAALMQLESRNTDSGIHVVTPKEAATECRRDLSLPQFIVPMGDVAKLPFTAEDESQILVYRMGRDIELDTGEVVTIGGFRHIYGHRYIQAMQAGDHLLPPDSDFDPDGEDYHKGLGRYVWDKHIKGVLLDECQLTDLAQDIPQLREMAQPWTETPVPEAKPAPMSKREIERESKQIARRLKEINERMDIAYDVAINDPQSLQKLEAERAALFQRKRELTEELRALLQPEVPSQPDEDEPPAWTVSQRLYQERKSLAVAGGVPILNVADAREHERLVREAVARGELANPYMLLKDYPDLLEADVLYVEDVYGTTYQVSRYDYERGANQIRIYAEKDGSLTFRSLLPDDDPRRKDGETLHRDNIAKVLDAPEPSDDDEAEAKTDLAAGEDTPPAWQMTRQEFRQYRADQLKAVGRDHAEPFETLRLHPSGSGEQVGEHQLFVEEALAEGKPVPTQVLADYPDLWQPWTWTLEQWLKLEHRYQRSGTDMYYIPPIGKRVLWPGTTSKKAVARQQHKLEVQQALYQAKNVSGEVLADYPDLAEQFKADEAALSDDGPTADPTICDNAYRNAFGRDRESVARIPMCQNNPVERVVTIYDDETDPKDGVVVRLCTECYTWLREDARLCGYRIRSKPFESGQAEPAEAEPPVEDWQPDDQDLAEFDRWEMHLLTGMLGKKSSAFYKALRQVTRPGTLRLALQSANGSRKRRDLIEKRLAELVPAG